MQATPLISTSMNRSTESIWQACSSQLRAYIARRISNPSLADDILQDVFIKIHENIDTLRDNTKIASWVYNITNNSIVDYYRKHKLEPIDIDTFAEKDLSTLLDLESSQASCYTEHIAAGLPAMIDALPEKYSQALTMVELEGISQVELAQKLNLSLSGAKSRVQRGRQLLKDTLMQCCHYEFDRYGTIISAHPIKCCCCHQYDHSSKR